MTAAPDNTPEIETFLATGRVNFSPRPIEPAWPHRETKLARLFWLTLLASGLASIEAGLWLIRGYVSG